MGVDWYECRVCGEMFNDCCDMVWCECGKSWCSDECAEKDGYINEGPGDSEDDVYSCKYCRKEDVEDSELIQFLLGKHQYIDRASAVKEYFKERE